MPNISFARWRRLGLQPRARKYKVKGKSGKRGLSGTVGRLPPVSISQVFAETRTDIGFHFIDPRLFNSSLALFVSTKASTDLAKKQSWSESVARDSQDGPKKIVAMERALTDNRRNIFTSGFPTDAKHTFICRARWPSLDQGAVGLGRGSLPWVPLPGLQWFAFRGRTCNGRRRSGALWQADL